MLEKELRVLHLDTQVEDGDCVSHWGQLKHSGPQSTQHSITFPPTRPHLLQQGHTYFNKATPPNSATPTGTICSGPLKVFLKLFNGQKVTLMK